MDLIYIISLIIFYEFTSYKNKNIAVQEEQVISPTSIDLTIKSLQEEENNKILYQVDSLSSEETTFDYIYLLRIIENIDSSTIIIIAFIIFSISSAIAAIYNKKINK